MVYADTSALAKLVLHEPESDALAHWAIESEVRFLTAALTLTELPRAVMRTNTALLPEVRNQLQSCGIINLDASIYEEASRIGPPALRSLDAIHLTAALHLGNQLGAFLTYDERLAEAARGVGIRPISISA
ncbi:MAG: type II toxin-antitoxin system VapC family toxin [Leucobacter sp.]